MTNTISPTEKLFEAMGLSEYTEQEQEQLLVDVSDTIFQSTLMRLIEKMDTGTRNDFNKLMDSNADGESVVSFLKQRVKNADDAMRESVREVTEDIVSLNLPKTAS